ncbi:MAG TPA: PAS domain S-box protein [Thermoanaerobaculia bacterium]|nr:PAS domain S-box protein [Thermoanaerobaculia bacterium]
MGEPDSFRILILADGAADAEQLERELCRAGMDAVCQLASSEDEFLAGLERRPDLVLAGDRSSSGLDARAALRAVRASTREVPVIVVTDPGGDEAVTDCLRAGASDYLFKDRLGRLGQAVRNAVEQNRQRRERQRSTEALRASEEQYQMLFEEAPQAMWVIEAETLRFLEVNRKAVERYGYTREEFLARTLVDIRPPEDVPSMLAAVRRVFAGEVRTGRRRHFTKTGELREVSVASHPLFFAGRRALLAVVEDVTERDRAEAQLRRSQQLLQAIVDGAAAAIYVKDAAGRFLLVNRRFETLVGSREEIAGRLDSDLYPAELVERFRANDRRVFDSRSPIEYEEEVAHRGESRTYWSVRFPIFDPDGGLYAVCGISTDITDRKQLEAQLRQAQKMEAIGQLAGGVAHDFNNLLTAILGYGQLLAGKLAARPDLRDHVDEIRKAGERAAALTRQLLAFSRSQVLQPREVVLSAVAADIENMLRRIIGENVELVTHLRSPHGRVVVDPGQIEQVIVNLAVNARDAMPAGGKLILETADVELDEVYSQRHPEALPGPHVMIAVSDSGHGMDAETRLHIFEPFFTTKEPGKGTGLGLSTVYGIVRQSGGHVEVESAPGRGSIFRIYLPRVAAAAEGQPATPATREAPPAALEGSETVLLIEDEIALRNLIRSVLESGGYTVLDQETPEAALLLAKHHAGPIDLVLTDVNMPGISGPDVAARLAWARPEAKVLFMSGYAANTAGHRNALPAGAQLLEKPFSAAGLLQKVRKVLDKP